MNNYETCCPVEDNRTNVSTPLPPMYTLDTIASEQKEMVINLRETLKVIDDSIGQSFKNDIVMEKREPCMLTYFKDTNDMLAECLRMTENIKINLGVN